ncbi:hypothetical protein Q31b_33700 [Novipirellula aureliae]|uniref:Uncharacterized protein n=1 Tax=Novipirellula aureliae TaxID=2527966 RepID=A0A5C6DY72_9BACT|nr:hypothetical protein Q31b_33700 [Novipirellula aureliae]
MIKTNTAYLRRVAADSRWRSRTNPLEPSIQLKPMLFPRLNVLLLAVSLFACGDNPKHPGADEERGAPPRHACSIISDNIFNIRVVILLPSPAALCSSRF